MNRLSNKYIFLFKTGDSEIRALSNFSSSKKHLLPIIELTRGRKSTKDKIGIIEKRLEKIEKLFENQDICIDLTTSEHLSNPEIDDLYRPDQGYERWVSFIGELNNSGKFKSVIPTILVNVDDPQFEHNLPLQVSELCILSKSLIYRNSISDDGCYDDIDLISETINSNKTHLLFIIDCEYIPPGAWTSFADKAVVRINKLTEKVKNISFIILSTSFPKYIGEIGKDDSDTFRLNEIDLFERILNQIENESIFYSDYATINPIRNDLVIMSRGWIPRIDVPLKDQIFYYRQRRGEKSYSETYSLVARNHITTDRRFPYSIENTNWGIKQIIECSEGSAPGSSPSFWISVRMNIHIEQQLKRLKLL